MRCQFRELGRKLFEVVTIEDLNGVVSVTNDIESVLDHYNKQGIDTVFYYDSEGVLTGANYDEHGKVQFSITDTEIRNLILRKEQKHLLYDS